jgi:hypothetical protein
MDLILYGKRFELPTGQAISCQEQGMHILRGFFIEEPPK